MEESPANNRPYELFGVPILDYFKNLLEYNVDFEEDNPNYRCVFKKVHILNAAKFLILIELAFVLFYMVITFPWWLLWIFFHLPVVLITIVAIKKESPMSLIPKIVFVLVQIFLFIMFICVSFIIGISANAFLGIFGIGPIDNLLARWILTGFIKMNLFIVLILIFWKFTVFWTLRSYFERKHKDEIDLDDPAEQNLLSRILRPL